MGQPVANWSPEKCKGEEKKARKLADSCLLPKTTDKRKACLEKGMKKFAPEFMEACRGMMEPMRKEYIDKEKAKYADQASAFGDEGGGDRNNGMKGPDGMPMPNMPMDGNHPPKDMGKPDQAHKGDHGKKFDCEKMAKKVRKEGDQCLKKKEQAKRKVCFDKIGEEIGKSGAGEACDPALKPLKEEFSQKEKAQYPNEPSSLDN